MGSSSASLFEFWIFFFKVSLSGECSVLACFVAGPGLALPPTSSNRLSISGAGLRQLQPQRGGGAHTANQLQQHLFRNGVFENRVLVAVNSRKVAIMPSGHRAIGPSCHRAIVPSCHPGPCLFDNLNEDFLGKKASLTWLSEVSLEDALCVN